MPDSLLHELQHAMPPCLSRSPGVCSNPCPLSRWCDPTISASATPFSFCLQSFLASEYFPMSWLKYLSWSFSSSPSNEYSGLISFRIDRFDHLVVQETLKSLLYYSSKASTLRHLAFFMDQLSHLYMTIGRAIALTVLAFVGKMMSLLLSIVPRFVIAFLPRSKHLEISWFEQNITTKLMLYSSSSISLTKFE